MKHWKYLPSLALLAAGLVHAHLGDGSLLPAGGETLKVGDSFTITWDVAESHNSGIDIALSKNSGTNWTNIKTNFEDSKTGKDTFKWTIPADAVTSQGKIRICQVGPCSDTQNTPNPSGKAPWRLISGTFAISASAAINTASAAKGLLVGFRPETRNVEVAFTLAQPDNVELHAYDMQGHKVASLLQGRFEAGEHVLSVFSNGLAPVSGALVFKLRVGEEVRTHTWLSLR